MTIPASHRRFLDLERQATSAIFYSGEIIHGMLQTRGLRPGLLRWNNLPPPEVLERRAPVLATSLMLRVTSVQS